MIYGFKAEQNQANLNFDIELQKDKRVYCFIGENGAGKTQLLETMAKSFLYCHSLFRINGNYNKYFYLKDGVIENIRDLKLYLPQEIVINNSICKDKNNQAWGVTSFDKITNQILPIAFDKPIVYIGAKNRGYAKNLDQNNVRVLGDDFQRFLSSFMKSYQYFNGQTPSDESVVDWFVSRLIINTNFVQGQTIAEKEVIFLCELLQELEPEKLKDIYIYDRKTNTNKFSIGFADGKLFFNGIPFEKLSTGYIAIVKIFQDIVDGFSSWRLDDNEDISQIEGVVFIDEIEAHMHPKWEQKIIPLLKKFFPKATFYVATHSPVVIASTDEGEAYELVREDMNITARELGNPKAWYMADIYSQAFHIVPSNDSKVEQNELISLTSRYSDLVKEYVKSNSIDTKSEIDKIYKQLNKKLAVSDPRRITIENLKSLVK